MTDRCRAMTFHRRRCRNRCRHDDPLYCHRHSKEHPVEQCLATHIRNGRPCTRKAAPGSSFCAHHQPRDTTPRPPARSWAGSSAHAIPRP